MYGQKVSYSHWLAEALEIGVLSGVWHGRQQVCPFALRWAQQRGRQDLPQLGFLAAAMGPGPLFEYLHEGVIDTSHQQVSHGVTPALMAMLSIVGYLVRPAGDRASGSC